MDVERVPDRRVEHQAGPPGERLEEPVHVGDRCVRQDHLGLRMLLDERGEVRGERSKAATCMEQDRDTAFGGERERGAQVGMGDVEDAVRRMELDAGRPAVERPLELCGEAVSRLGAAERDESPFRGGALVEELVVQRGIRVSAGRAKRDDEGSLDAVSGHLLEELSRLQARAVGIAAEVRVRVPYGLTGRDEGRDEALVCLLQRLVRQPNDCGLAAHQ